MSKYIKIFILLIENNTKINTLFDIAKIDYIKLYDKDNKSYLFVKHCDAENISDKIYNKLIQVFRESEIISIKETSQGADLFLTHEISIIDGVSVEEVDYFAIGKRFAQLTLKNGKRRRSLHTPWHPYKFKDNSKMMHDKVSNKVYVVTKYRSGD